jgi:hypothetical protein
VVAAEIDEVDDGEFVERNSLLGADGLQRGVDVRQMSERDVADAGVDDFVFAHAAMEPAEEEGELDGDRQERGEETGDRWLGECEVVESHGLASLAIARMKKNS